jgi:biotin carboxyl carrier protein
MHGRVLSVAAVAGARVERGDLLFSVEAMKMEHAVTASIAGMVKTVRIAAGQQVEQGMLAVLIEADPEK